MPINPFGPQDKPPPATQSAETGRPEIPPVIPTQQPGIADPDPNSRDPVDAGYWLRCLSDAEAAERDWRTRGREIIRIYRNDGYYTPLGKKKLNKDIVFNILFSNTEVMLPNVYSQAPKPVVRSRFVKKSEPVPPPPPPPMPPPPPPTAVAGPPGPPPQAGGPGVPFTPSPGGLSPQAVPPMGAGGPPPTVGGPPMGAGALPVAGQNMGAGAEQTPPDISLRITTEDTTPPPPPEPPEPPKPEPPVPTPMTMPMRPAPPPPGMPAQQDIETAAAVMEKALEIVLDDNAGNEAVKAAVKDLLLPGRGVCRVRWHPQLAPAPPPPAPVIPPTDQMALGGAGLPGAAPPAPEPPEPELVKVWETVYDEYVYWEDILLDPCRQFRDTQWIAFRHLFTQSELLKEFSDCRQIQDMKARNTLSDVVKWTELSAAKQTVGGGGAMKPTDKLGNVIRKAMVWEIWDRNTRTVIWFIREAGGIVLRQDPDALGLSGFFPIPRPLLAVTTTDSQLPRPYYDLYQHLAADLDETSRRISQLTEKIKVRGGYNSANRDIAQLLLADDGKMIPVDAVDLMSGGLSNHIFLVPIIEWVNALKELYLARDQIKATIYEVMGISDIMRGNTNPYETATAQRIKGTMGTNRLDGQKVVCANFALDLLRMKAEIIANNFDASTLTRMTGEEVTPAVEAILRDDFQRVCAIDIETDSTVSIDEQVEQEGNAKMLMAMQGILQGAQGLLMTGVLPPPMVIQFTLELIKMMVHPLRNSRGVVELIDDFQEQLQKAAMMQAMMPPPPQPPGPPGPPGAGPPGAPPHGAPGVPNRGPMGPGGPSMPPHAGPVPPMMMNGGRPPPMR